VKIIIKWSKNAFREVPKLKIFLPRGRGTLFPWTLSSHRQGSKGKDIKKMDAGKIIRWGTGIIFCKILCQGGNGCWKKMKNKGKIHNKVV